MKALFKSIACLRCASPYPKEAIIFRCPNCGGIYDFIDVPNFSIDLIDPNLKGVWRYRQIIGFEDQDDIITLGEGNTPLIWDKVDGVSVGFKLEYLNPTASFKDRGSTVLVSVLHASGIKQAVEDSSGNAGASFSAYASRAGIKARIFVPQTASGPKRAQIIACGATIVLVPGSRSQVTAALLDNILEAEVYASHVFQPFGISGYATIAYELFEEMHEEPGSIVCPVGQGGLILGMSLGFQALLNSGLISRMPELIGVQAQPCAPLWARYQYGDLAQLITGAGETIAEGIRIDRPVRADKILQAIKVSQGRIIAVAESDILPGRDQLARRGFYVEPTSAVVWPAIEALKNQIREPIIAILTGAGYKYSSEVI